MSSLFRSLSTFSPKRENSIKETLISTLKENVDDIEYEIEESASKTLELSEATNNLCVTLEAIFLHGLKDSLLWHTINIITGTSDEVNRRPEPSYWSPLLVYLHKQVIEQLQTFTQIHCEIGQCRAWVRLSLNESLLSSYMRNMRRNSGALGSYYKKYALLRDRNYLEMAAKIMEQLEATSSVAFNLPVNSSLLNHWSDMTLQLSGLWTPSLKAQPINSGVDVAGSLVAQQPRQQQQQTPALPTPQPLSMNEPFADYISNSPFSQPGNFGGAHDEATRGKNLERFLKRVDEMEAITETADAADEQEETAKENERNSLAESTSSGLAKLNIAEGQAQPQMATVGGNSLSNLMQTSWSDGAAAAAATAGCDWPEPAEPPTLRSLMERSNSTSESIYSRLSVGSARYDGGGGDRCSYNALLRSHSNQRQGGNDYADIFDKIIADQMLAATPSDAGPAGMGAADGGGDGGDGAEDSFDRTSMGSRDGFELINELEETSSQFNISQLHELLEQLCKLAHEPGLDAQGFVCRSCLHPLGIGATNFKVCAFSGHYYCDACMEVEASLIPAKVIYNWDFGKYAISKQAAAFLAEVRQRPILDFMRLNPTIYNASEVMADLQSLRIRLNFVRAYLQTCNSDEGGAGGGGGDGQTQQNAASEALRLEFYGREYLYEEIHQYSIGDLVLIQRGVLQQQLQKAFKAGEKHILRCKLCSLKGFICEKCQVRRVLYPFHIDTTFRCERCGAVFHAHCLNERQACPRCQRRSLRSEDKDLYVLTPPTEEAATNAVAVTTETAHNAKDVVKASEVLTTPPVTPPSTPLADAAEQ